MLKNFLCMASILITTQLYATTIESFTASNFRITNVANGVCLSASTASTQTNAWRCYTGKMTLDPCFNLPNQRGLICPDNPWSKAATRVILNKPLLNTPRIANSARLPWAVELADGSKCVLLTRTTFAVDNQRVNYVCENNTYLFGTFVKKANQDWTIKQLNLATQQKTVTAVIKIWP